MKVYCKIFLIAMTMSFVSSLAADELSERINDLHQNLTQLRSKLKKLENGLDTISKRLRGEPVETEEAKIEDAELLIDYSDFVNRVNEIISCFGVDIAGDFGLVKEVKTFHEGLFEKNHAEGLNLQKITSDNAKKALPIIKKLCLDFINDLLKKYKESEIISLAFNPGDYEYGNIKQKVLSTDLMAIKDLRRYTDKLKVIIDMGDKSDNEILTEILPNVEWRTQGSRLAFVLLQNGFRDPGFLWWATTAILWYIGQQPHGSGEQYKPTLDGALYYLFEWLGDYKLLILPDSLKRILMPCQDYVQPDNGMGYAIRLPGEESKTFDIRNKHSVSINNKPSDITFRFNRNPGEGFTETGKKARAEILAAIYARQLMSNIMELEKHIEIEKKRLDKEREEEKRKKELQDKMNKAKNDKEEQEKFIKEAEDRAFNESIKEIKDELKINEKPAVELSGLLEVIKLIAAININEDIIAAASKHHDKRVKIFNCVDYLGELLPHINANELRSNKSLKELLGYTHKIICNILASNATLQGMLVRMDQFKNNQSHELKAVAELMRCLLLIKDEHIIFPSVENRLTQINPVDNIAYAAIREDASNTNILKHYFRLIARAENAKEEALEFYKQYKDYVKMGFKMKLMNDLSIELDKQK